MNKFSKLAGEVFLSGAAKNSSVIYLSVLEISF